MIRTGIIILIVVFFGCEVKEEFSATIITRDSPEVSIAFGSCAHSYDTLEILNAVNSQKPDVWVWLGDIVYGDTHDMTVMREKYDRQKAKPEYQELLAQTRVIGIWDDHDYGVNDGGKYYSKKKASKEELLRFLDVAENDPVRSREGAYAAYSVTAGDKEIKIILPDTRYFRDTLDPDTLTLARYLPNTSGTVLGEAQWSWLRQELEQSTADLHIVGMSIQLIAEEQGFEKWANFPRERERFFNLLKEASATVPTLVISGDRHIAELSKIDIEGLGYPLYDLTASGLTHTWGMARPEPNKYRVDSLIVTKNFGLLDIGFPEGSPVVNLQVLDEAGKVLLNEEISY